MSPTEIAELHQAVGQLKRCMGVLRSRYGDARAVRRIAIDVDRLELDLGEFEDSPPPIRPSQSEPEIIYVPDAKSDEAAWMGAQDEGLGFHSRARTL